MQLLWQIAMPTNFPLTECHCLMGLQFWIEVKKHNSTDMKGFHISWCSRVLDIFQQLHLHVCLRLKMMSGPFPTKRWLTHTFTAYFSFINTLVTLQHDFSGHVLLIILQKDAVSNTVTVAKSKFIERQFCGFYWVHPWNQTAHQSRILWQYMIFWDHCQQICISSKTVN